jgi:hypothetical protein
LTEAGKALAERPVNLVGDLVGSSIERDEGAERQSAGDRGAGEALERQRLGRDFRNTSTEAVKSYHPAPRRGL